jgi:elongation factor Ts
MSVSAADVKALRDRTGAGMMDSKRALEEANGEREAAEGVVSSYVHSNHKIGVLVEIDCETDFVARNHEFREFARDIAIHIAGAPVEPRWVSEEDVPASELEEERKVLAQQADSSKPPEVQEKMTEGRLRKWLQEVVLLKQPHVHTEKHENRTIEELRADISAKTGENVVIRRFARFKVGE